MQRWCCTPRKRASLRVALAYGGKCKHSQSWGARVSCDGNRFRRSRTLLKLQSFKTHLPSLCTAGLWTNHRGCSSALRRESTESSKRFCISQCGTYRLQMSVFFSFWVLVLGLSSNNHIVYGKSHQLRAQKAEVPKLTNLQHCSYQLQKGGESVSASKNASFKGHVPVWPADIAVALRSRGRTQTASSCLRHADTLTDDQYAGYDETYHSLLGHYSRCPAWNCPQ